jgi:hypothetical protein
MIIQASDGTLYLVHDFSDPDLAHVWEGIAVKRTAAGYVPQAGAKWTPVRKAATRIVAYVPEAGAEWTMVAQESGTEWA